MEHIRDKDGNVVHSSKNLRGVREYARNKSFTKTVSIKRVAGNDEGLLSVVFNDGCTFQTNFADFNLLRAWIRNWKDVYGAELLIDNATCGIVNQENKELEG